MSLERLPAETLRQIFDQISSSFFREDLGRLTVSKRWFEFALPACFRCITLSQETLRSLVVSGTIQRTSRLEDSIETLDLKLGEHESCIDSDLAQLATVVQQSHKLRTIRVRACAYISPEASGEYMPLIAIQAFLSVENLRVLVLDLSGSNLNFSGQQEEDRHICPAIGAALHTLQHLHLRMRTVCSDVLKPRNPNGSLRLSVVAINLSLASNLPGITSAAHSRRCGPHGGGLPRLKEEMQEQAEALVTRMEPPQVMRILTHSLPGFDIQSLDVLTGRTMVLDDDMAWDVDGKIIEEDSEPESELLEEEFSTYLDD